MRILLAIDVYLFIFRLPSVTCSYDRILEGKYSNNSMTLFGVQTDINTLRYAQTCIIGNYIHAQYARTNVRKKGALYDIYTEIG